jgi:hypothetical protein
MPRRRDCTRRFAVRARGHAVRMTVCTASASRSLGNPGRVDSRHRFASAPLEFAAEREASASTNQRRPSAAGCRMISSTMRIWANGKRRVKDTHSPARLRNQSCINLPRPSGRASGRHGYFRQTWLFQADMAVQSVARWLFKAWPAYDRRLGWSTAVDLRSASNLVNCMAGTLALRFCPLTAASHLIRLQHKIAAQAVWGSSEETP